MSWSRCSCCFDAVSFRVTAMVGSRYRPGAESARKEPFFLLPLNPTSTRGKKINRLQQFQPNRPTLWQIDILFLQLGPCRYLSVLKVDTYRFISTCFWYIHLCGYHLPGPCIQALHRGPLLIENSLPAGPGLGKERLALKTKVNIANLWRADKMLVSLEISFNSLDNRSCGRKWGTNKCPTSFCFPVSRFATQLSPGVKKCETFIRMIFHLLKNFWLVKKI